MKWYRLYKESNDSDFVIKDGVLEKYTGKGGNVVIPNDVTSIGYKAFWRCSGLTSMTIPESVTSIRDDAFGHCRGLKSVTIGRGVTSIGENAFYNCRGLTSVTMPNVTNIGWCAFAYCSELESVTFGGGVTRIEKDAFFGCRKLTTVKIKGKTDNQIKEMLKDAVDNISMINNTNQSNNIESFIKQFNGINGFTDAYVSTKGIPCIKISTWDVKLPEEYVDFRYTVKCKRTLNSSNEKWVPIERNALSDAVESVIGRFPFTTKNTPDEIEKLIFVLDFTDYN